MPLLAMSTEACFTRFAAMFSNRAISGGRLARSITLIAFVTTVFLTIAANRLTGEVLQIGVFAIGAIAFVTAITSFLIALSQYEDSTELPSR